MERVQSTKELMEYISKMNRENSVGQFFIPGKGRFTLVLQEEDEPSISDDVAANPALDKMITESKQQYQQGLGYSTKELLESFTSRDFMS
ncbi:hypothetical protein [Geomicrobium sediminis]|uniref:Prevent-host-death protein n=1 Tax=Geomicrobium sediminis TaxID=1347788 RepID=A0ABS2PG43_9BACL|nr:hypothetical protein [Geomicrobium sediminis]MBM7634015.1 hypothetical protein [Geomicrobium sediminis]